MPKVYKRSGDDIADLMWPSLSSQLFPRDAENIDLRTCRIGDRIYGNVFISLFPKDIQTFTRLYNRLLSTQNSLANFFLCCKWWYGCSAITSGISIHFNSHFIAKPFNQ